MKKLSVLLFNQGGRCFYCDEILDIHEASIDHVIPQSKGGKDDMDNLVVCCKYANRAFGDCSPKQKIAVAKNLCASKRGCQKIFIRESNMTSFPSEKSNLQDIQEATIEHGSLSTPTLQNSKSSLPHPKEKERKNSLPSQKTSVIRLSTQDVQAQKIAMSSLSKAYQFLYQAIDALEKQGAEVVSCRLKQEIKKLEPSFKESDYGFKQFNKFLLQAKKDKIISLEQYKTANNYLVKKV